MLRKVISIFLQLATLLSCFAMLALPGWKTDEKAAEAVQDIERRKAARKPDWPTTLDQWLEYPAKLDAYVDDNHGYRSKAIKFNSQARLRLGESSSKRVVIGLDGFMYYDGDRQFLDLERAIPLDPQVRADRLQVWSKWSHWMEARGARLIIAPIPTKGLIHKRHLPRSVHRYLPHDRNEEFFHALRTEAGIPVADLRDGMREAATKENRLLYFKTDSHYNNLGAYHAYRLMMKSIVSQWPEVASNVVEKIRIERGMKRKTDLANLIYMAEEFEEEDTQAKLAEPLPITQSESRGRDGRGYRLCSNAQRKGPRVLVFHDSFGWDLQRFFCQSFPEVLMVHHDFKGPNKTAIEAFKPELVVFELAEYGFLDEFAAP